MNDLGREVRRRLAAGPLLLDGAVGTELERRGVPAPPPLWSAAALRTHPQVVQQIHAEYAAAGADILVANTFRTNVRTLRRAGIADQGPRLNQFALELVRRAAADSAAARLVAASVAPVEDCYEPELVPDEATLRREHARHVRWLADAGAEWIWIETMGTVREARAAAAAAADAGLPFTCTFVTREDGSLLGGESIEAAFATLEPLDPLALGVNCIPPRGVAALLPRLRAATRRPLIVYAHVNNASPTPGWSYAQRCGARAYAAAARRWLEHGARIVGGCCGTTPAHVAALRGLLDSLCFASRGRG